LTTDDLKSFENFASHKTDKSCFAKIVKQPK